MLGHIIRVNRAEGVAFVRQRDRGQDVIIRGSHIPNDARVGDVISFETRFDGRRGRAEAVDVRKLF